MTHRAYSSERPKALFMELLAEVYFLRCCRPFGDLNLALLATERLAVLYDCLGHKEVATRQVRDMGLLLCHLKQYSSAQEALKQYEDWIRQSDPADMESTIQSMQKAKQGGPVMVSKEEADIVAQVLVKAAREALEKQIK
jgi:hypothetical protein